MALTDDTGLDTRPAILLATCLSAHFERTVGIKVLPEYVVTDPDDDDDEDDEDDEEDGGDGGDDSNEGDDGRDEDEEEDDGPEEGSGWSD